MLAKIRNLFEELNQRGIRYCHWKSNFALAETVSGQTDVDLLIHRQDAPLFRSLMSELSFRPAISTDGKPFPSVEHCYALDDNSGDLVHVHAYYRVITGDSLTKNYRLPVEDMLLENTREEETVRVPTKAAELVIFTLRIMLKHTSLTELVLLSRYWKQAREEAIWLTEADALDKASDLVNCWLPPLDAKLFVICTLALKSPASLWKRVILGHRLRSRLRIYARHSAIYAKLSGIRKFMIMLLRRLRRSQRGMIPLSGGAVIAFVGAEATGKSTLICAISDWLGKHFAVESSHIGKPAPTALSAIPSLLLPVLRSILPNYRSTRIQAKYAAGGPSDKPKKSFPLIFGIRSVLLAYDRRSLLTRAFGKAANGTILLCDRYPSVVSGALDSPQLSHFEVSRSRYSLYRLLAVLESRLYREIPAPDLVVYLTAPLELTVSRNANREKKEPEDYVRRRHAQSSNLDFGRTPIHRINTDQPFDRTVYEVKQAIWNAL